MIRRPPRSTLDRSSAASDVYKRQPMTDAGVPVGGLSPDDFAVQEGGVPIDDFTITELSLIHISEPTRPY